MTPIEKELRATFARHEALTPAVGPVRAGIDLAWVRVKRRRTIRRSVAAAAAVLMAGSAVPVMLQRWQHQPPPVSAVDVPPAAATSADPINVLLLGSDNRLRAHDPKDRRADTVMVLHVPADRSRAFLVSLPRDGEVKLTDGARVKLSTTLLLGGPALSEQAVSSLTGVTFDATVTVDFRALRAVTAAVGGVQLCLSQAVKSVHSGKTYRQGCQQVGADDVGPVLQARSGLADGSYDRDRNTQRFLRALAVKLAADGTFTDPARVQALLAAGRDGMEVDGDPAALLRVAASLASPEPVGVGGRGLPSTGDGRERIYPGVGPSLWAAIRADTLTAWTTANPSYVLR